MSLRKLRSYIAKRIFPHTLVTVNFNISTGGRVVLGDQYIATLVDEIVEQVEAKTKLPTRDRDNA
jgi:hypothetical protein